MGYLWLAVALAGGIAKGLCGKKISGQMGSFRDCLFINTVRMLLCAVIALLTVLAASEGDLLQVSPRSIEICGVCAVGMSVFCVCWMYAYRTEAYIFLNIFTMLGTVVTCLLDLWIYGTTMGPYQWLGIGAILGAVVIVSRYNRETKGKLRPKGIAILILGCLGSAVADFTQKIYMTELGGSAAVYNFYSYALAAVLLAAGLGICAGLGRSAVTPSLRSAGSLLLCGAISAGLFVNSTAKTLAAGLLPAAQIYPVLQGANLIASILLGQFLFGERITVKSVLGMLCAFVGLLLVRGG